MTTRNITLTQQGSHYYYRYGNKVYVDKNGNLNKIEIFTKGSKNEKSVR